VRSTDRTCHLLTTRRSLVIEMGVRAQGTCPILGRAVAFVLGVEMIRRVTADALFPPPRYSHVSVAEAGTTLGFLAGAVPLDAEGELVGRGDPVAQAEQVLANLGEQLAAVGSGLEHVLATTVHVVSSEPSTLSAVWRVVQASGLSSGPHSSTLVGVACLGYPGQLVEITATAVVP
jgi:enamine deaminase RidA (YjgF/YER057c/UK114 family)